MREIKFRGVRVDNGEWVFGNYIKVTPYKCSDGHRICSQDTWDMFPVEPKTVGQYTGLKDKNGKEIYEGDIVYVGGYGYEEPEEEWEGEIGMTPFGWVLLGHDSQDYHDCFNLNEIGGSYKTIYEVLGNKYQNPELMEVNE